MKQAVLYGSRARGTYRNGSDIDLTLRGDNLEERTMAKIEDAFDELLLPYNFSLSAYDSLRNPELLTRIRDEGITFYERAAMEEAAARY